VPVERPLAVIVHVDRPPPSDDESAAARGIREFLHDWWPIRAEARLADRLAAMPVRVVSELQPAAAG